MSAENDVVSPSRWARLGKELKDPKYKICPSCVEERLWSRNTCQICGTMLLETRNDPTQALVKYFEAKFGPKYWSWEEWKKKHPGEKD